MTNPDNTQAEAVAWACAECGVATQINYRDKADKIIGHSRPQRCIICGSYEFEPLTQEEYDKEYGDD